MADDPRKDVEKAALDLLIATRRVAAPVNNGQAHVGGKDFLEMTVEALVATAHFIAAAARVEDPEVQEAVRKLSASGEEPARRLSIDDLLATRRRLES